MSILARTGFSINPDSFGAGVESARMVWEYVKDPDLIIVFASIFHNHEMVLKGINSIIKDTPLIGGSSFGEITNYGMNNNSVVLMAIKADKIKFSLGLGNDSDKDPVKAGEEAAKKALMGLGKKEAQIGIFISEMLGSGKSLKGLQNVLAKEFGLFGGCCSGNRKVPISAPEFALGYQYFNDKIYQHNIPLLLLSGDFKYSFGIGHGWRQLGKTVRVGRTKENTIYEIDNISAFDFYKGYIGDSSFVSHPLGFYQNDRLILRATTGTAEKGGLNFTTELAPGTEVRITRGSRNDIYKSSKEAAKQALDGLKGAKPMLGIIISCVSRRTMLGSRAYKESEVIQEVLGKELPLIGGYCAGEYAPVSGINFYHNFTFCLCLLGEEIGEKTKEVPIQVSGKPKTEKDKILIITKKENLASDCKTALTGLEFDFEWIKDNLDLEDSLKKNIPGIVILETANEQLIQKIKKADQSIQIILLIEKEKEAGLNEIIRKLGENISGFCLTPFQMFELQFLVKKALETNKIYIRRRVIEKRLIEIEEDLNEAENSIEVSEKVLMESYNQIEMAKNGLAEKVKERTKELEEARNGLEIKVQERTKELKESQEKLIQASKMAAVGQLAGGIAHEMNNPLTVILGFAECLAKRLSPGDALEMPIKSIEREAIRCGKLVQDLLVFSRSQKTEAEELDVVKTIEGAMSLISARAKNGNIKLVRAFGKNIPHIFANSNQLQQAVINLANNAFDAMGERGTLTIRAHSLDENWKRWAQIQVEDTGTGIPEEIRSRIFEPFFTTKEPGKGVGLGLGLCYEIVKNVGGTITFTTETGKGTCFTVRLPAVDEGANANRNEKSNCSYNRR